MPTDHRAQLRDIRTFPQLIRYLRDEMGWPIDRDDFEELTFEYTPEELGIDTASAAKIQEIKRLRPLSPNQPWGIFFVKFEPKRLPVVALRRILSRVALKKRASANSAERAAWATNDLLFVSNFGEGDERQISFAHFSQDDGKIDLPTLKVLGWDNLDTTLHLDHVAELLTERLAWPDDDKDVALWRESWRSAFTLRNREVITTSRALAVRLAELARAIRDRIWTALAIETERGPLTKLMKAFQEALIHDLDAGGFADMYAQTIAYGLLSARVTNPEANTADGFAAQLPVTNPFLKELMETFLQVGGRNGKVRRGPAIDFDELGVSEVVELLDDANMEAVVRDFGDKNPQEDPVIHFYERFLKEYDAKKRMQRGVFYTPRPVVSYIVRSVHEILQSEFGLADGLADTATWGEMAKRHAGLSIPEGAKPIDRFVTVLDPATGTGTFLVEAIEVIHHALVEKWTREGHGEKKILDLWNDYVPKHLLPRLHGYELLMAPYAIAHLKIGLKLHETGYRFDSDERARIYLTNALDPASDSKKQMEFKEWIPALAHEAEAVNAVKSHQRFTVVIGNPPYSGHSWNLTPTLRRSVEPYRFVDGQRIKEKGALQLEKSIQDDYIKFFRCAELHVAGSTTGVVGLVTSHGFLDNPFLRGMRCSVLSTFQQVLVLDLHGNALRHVKAPDGSPDKNVFDIQRTGVAVSLLRRLCENGKRQVDHSEVWGTQDLKYRWLSSNSIGTTSVIHVSPRPPTYLLVPQDSAYTEEYERYFSLGDIMPVNSKGIVTGRDSFVVEFDEAALLERMLIFAESRASDETMIREFDLNPTAWWDVAEARRNMPRKSQLRNFVRPLLYRPFDSRPCFYHPAVLMSPRRPVMKHMDGGCRNILLITSRMTKGEPFRHVTVASGLAEAILLSSKTSNNAIVFPLYLYPQKSDTSLGLDLGRRPNLTPEFLQALSESIGLSVRDGAGDGTSSIGVDDVLRYFIAVLHSPAYRSRYTGPLSRDFPRMPLTTSLQLFCELARLGRELVALHLVEAPAQGAVSARYDKAAKAWRFEVARGQHSPVTLSFNGPEKPIVGKVGWSGDRVWIDAVKPKKGAADATVTGTVGFYGVPEDVWNVHIGGYQVCEKWLKDRKDRTLTADDIAHYHRIVIALHETIRLMREIDEVIDAHGGWPDAFALKIPAAVQVSAESLPLPGKSFEELDEVTEYGTPEDTAEEAPPLAAEQPGAGISVADDSENAGPQNPTPTGAALSILDTTREESIAAIRDLFSSPAHVAGLDREMAIRKVAQSVGFERTGTRIREFIEGDLLAAAHRRVIFNDRGTLRLDTTSIEDYSRDELKRHLLTVLGGKWWDQEEAIRAAARHLGFRRTGAVIQEAFKSAINGLIRQGQLERDDTSIRAVK